MKILTVFAIKQYKRLVSPYLPQSCRFHPTCSSYCLEAVEKFGFIKGMKMFVGRILKCHPFHAGGYDPVGTDSSRIN